MKKKRKKPILFARAKTEPVPEAETAAPVGGLPVRVGDRVTRFSESFGGTNEWHLTKPMTGTVIYVHPLGRFHAVEFTFEGGSVRECFAGVGRDGTPGSPRGQGAPGVPRFRLAGDEET